MAGWILVGEPGRELQRLIPNMILTDPNADITNMVGWIRTLKNGQLSYIFVYLHTQDTLLTSNHNDMSKVQQSESNQKTDLLMITLLFKLSR